MRTMFLFCALLACALGAESGDERSKMMAVFGTADRVIVMRGALCHPWMHKTYTLRTIEGKTEVGELLKNITWTKKADFILACCPNYTFRFYAGGEELGWIGVIGISLLRWRGKGGTGDGDLPISDKSSEYLCKRFGFVDDPPAEAPEKAEISLPPPAVPSGSAELRRIKPKLALRQLTLPVVQVWPRIVLQDFSDLNVISVDGLIDLFGSTKNLAIAMSAERIDVCRLHPKPNGSTASPGELMEEPIFTFSDDETVAVRAVLTCDSTYDWSVDYDCAPTYKIRLKLKTAQDVVDVDLCFACKTLRVTHGGKPTAEKNFDFGAETLAKLLEPHLPGTLEEITSQSPEPTPAVVKDRAGARSAPAGGVAHL